MIYLIAGESNQLIKDELDLLIKDKNNIVKVDFGNSSIDDTLSEASYYSLFNDAKTLIIRNANFFGSSNLSDADSKKLIKYFENPNDLTDLIFICYDKIDARKKIVKLIKEKYYLKVITNPTYKDIIKKVEYFVKKEKYSIDDQSINYIMSNCLNNYDLVYNEINKIMCYYDKPGKITYTDVVNITSKSLETNNFRFVDSLVSKNIIEASKIFNDLKLMKIEELSLLGLIAREYRLMLLAMILKQNKYSYYDIQDELRLQDWQLDKIMKNASLYTIADLKGNLKKLADKDLEIKSGRVDKNIALKEIIIDFCI